LAASGSRAGCGRAGTTSVGRWASSWTYSCISCIRTLPHLRDWYAAYHRDGFEIVGVHTPEFAFEHVLSNVSGATRDLGVTWPVALDNDYKTWSAYSNEYWPAEYPIDKQGRVRNPLRRRRIRCHRSLDPLARNLLSYAGQWQIGPERAIAGTNARLRQHFVARNVYVVLGGDGRVKSFVGGKKAGTIRVAADRLYTVVSGRSARDALLELRLSPGVNAYSFTFG
jgi:hypothetical protein